MTDLDDKTALPEIARAPPADVEEDHMFMKVCYDVFITFTTMQSYTFTVVAGCEASE